MAEESEVTFDVQVPSGTRKWSFFSQGNRSHVEMGNDLQAMIKVQEGKFEILLQYVKQ